MYKGIRRFAAFAAPVLLAGSAVVGLTGNASAATYSTDLTTLQNECLAQGQMASPVFADLEIPSTQVSYGSTGVCVALAQTLLNDRGLSAVCNNWQQLAVDGQDGPATTAVVKCAQGNMKLQVDGQVGPQTWSHIWYVN
jgi:peptidoglycan hydrolase-like protein with peptidoglycan-binding domain